MELFNQNGIATPKGVVAFTPEDAEKAYKSMGNRESIILFCILIVVFYITVFFFKKDIVKKGLFEGTTNSSMCYLFF